MTQINAYISFAGKCREAMTFYQQCLGGDLFLQTVAESPIADQCPGALQEHIIHSSLSKGAMLLMATDMAKYDKGSMVALALSCNTEEEINTFFTKLSAGGVVNQELKTEFWGATFGELTDKFGIRWMLNYDKNQK